uniref:Uncharacterized protein n=1 Tax=Cucumis melo TaxID=3656 RepID=A0A9I9CKF0_CUCME
MTMVTLIGLNNSNVFQSSSKIVNDGRQGLDKDVAFLDIDQHDNNENVDKGSIARRQGLEGENLMAIFHYCRSIDLL